MSDSESYPETIARLRAESHARQVADLEFRANTLNQEINESLEQAYEADQEGRKYDADFLMQDVREKEQALSGIVQQLPPPQQQLPQELYDFVGRNQSFFNRHGTKAFQVLDIAHAYACKPRTGSSNPALTGMGLQPFSPEYFGAMKDLLQMYGSQFGVHYDPAEESLTANDAAQMSGVSPRVYNREAKRMYETGADAFSRQSGQWGRKG